MVKQFAFIYNQNIFWMDMYIVHHNYSTIIISWKIL